MQEPFQSQAFHAVDLVGDDICLALPRVYVAQNFILTTINTEFDHDDLNFPLAASHHVVMARGTTFCFISS